MAKRTVYRSSMDKALVIAQKKRRLENERHDRRLAEINEEYWGKVYGRRK